MHRLVLCLPLFALVACASPQEQCLSQATKEARINAMLIAQTQGNLDRGFGLRTQERVRERRAFCRGKTESGESVVTRCEKVDVQRIKVPVALDLAAERAKLRSLQAQRTQLSQAAQSASAQCRILYPE